MEMIDEVRARIRNIVSGPGSSSRWIREHLEYSEDEFCLIWPFVWEVDHYPKYGKSVGGERERYVVSRLMCEYRHGPPPSPAHHAAHSCDRGTQGCVNPMHVSWKTPSENQLDRFKGEAIRSKKLTQEQANEIRRLAPTTLPKDLAKRFGVTVRNIRWVVQGKTWNPVRKIAP